MTGNGNKKSKQKKKAAKPVENQRDLFRERFTKAGVLFVFFATLIPGILALTIFSPVVLHPYIDSAGQLSPSASSFDSFILEMIIPERDNIPVEIITLIVAAAPIAFIRSVYIAGENGALSLTGKFSTVLLLIGFIVNLVGGFIISPTDALIQDNFAPAETLIQFKKLTDQCSYFCLFYFLVLLTLRPKEND